MLCAYGKVVTTGQDNVSVSTVKYPRNSHVAGSGPTADSHAAVVFPTVCQDNVREETLSPYHGPGWSRIEQTLFAVYSLQAVVHLNMPIRPRIYASGWKRTSFRSRVGSSG